MSNPWIRHVRQYMAMHPGISYRDALMDSKASYRPLGMGEGARKKRVRRARGEGEGIVRKRRARGEGDGVRKRRVVRRAKGEGEGVRKRRVRRARGARVV